VTGSELNRKGAKDAKKKPNIEANPESGTERRTLDGELRPPDGRSGSSHYLLPVACLPAFRFFVQRSEFSVRRSAFGSRFGFDFNVRCSMF